jgi:hypothetical protein
VEACVSLAFSSLNSYSSLNKTYGSPTNLKFRDTQYKLTTKGNKIKQDKQLKRVGSTF